MKEEMQFIDDFKIESECPKIEKDMISLCDTDSLYFCLDEVKEKYAPVIPFVEFAEIMEKKVLEPFFNKILQIRAEKYGVEQVINFKREGVIQKQLILAKKKYLVQILKDEDKEYDVPILKATGIEIKRTDCPLFCRNGIKETMNLLFEDDIPSKEKVMSYLKKIKKTFLKQGMEQISFNKSINEYRKYEIPLNENLLKYKSATPMHVRAGINYNYMIKKYKLPYVEVDNGTKVKYIYVKTKNILSTNVIAYIGNYPKEFEKYFEIDYKEQFNKSFLEIIQRTFDVLEWGTINFKSNKLKGLLG